MMKVLLLSAICLTIALASKCSSSCNCDPDCSICISCKWPDVSQMDEYKKACYCKAGYYTSSINPFQCSQALSNGTNLTLSNCDLEVALKSKYLQIVTDCSFATEGTANFVYSHFSLNFLNAPMDDQCKNAILISLQYESSSGYVDLPSQYITYGIFGSRTIKFPLIDVYKYAQSTTVGAQQITQVIYLQATISNSIQALLYHKWCVYVYTNRNQVQVFTVVIEILTTLGCQEECAVVADLNTSSQICDDHSCVAVKALPTYLVGDIFYAKIWFTDSTYTKKLSFVSLLFKNDVNAIYDFTSITVAEWLNNGLVISLPLVESSKQALIQVNMQIDPTRRVRMLDQSQNNPPVKTQFQLNVAKSDAQKNQLKDNKQSAYTIIFGLVNLMAIIILL